MFVCLYVNNTTSQSQFCVYWTEMLDAIIETPSGWSVDLYFLKFVRRGRGDGVENAVGSISQGYDLCVDCAIR